MGILGLSTSGQCQHDRRSPHCEYLQIPLSSEGLTFDFCRSHCITVNTRATSEAIILFIAYKTSGGPLSDMSQPLVRLAYVALLTILFLFEVAKH